jgi:hypothetical protein
LITLKRNYTNMSLKTTIDIVQLLLEERQRHR